MCHMSSWSLMLFREHDEQLQKEGEECQREKTAEQFRERLYPKCEQHKVKKIGGKKRI